MDEGGSRIRRRVSVRKRTRPSLCAAPIAAELKSDDEEEEEGMVAEYRRRKTVGVQPIEHYDSEEDMFGDYDSFAENSFLAQVDDLEQKYMQLPEHRKQDTDLATAGLCSESDENKLSIPAVFPESKTDEHTKNQSGTEDVPFEHGPDLPSSQVLYFENLQNSSNDLGDQSTEEKHQNSFSHKTGHEELFLNHIEQPQQDSDFSPKVRVSSDTNRRKSVKDHLKSAMTGNAKAQTPVFSRSKQLKETLLSEEINVAKKTIESSSDDLGPFYSLPSKVRDLYVRVKGIEKLYGNIFCWNENISHHYRTISTNQWKQSLSWSFFSD